MQDVTITTLLLKSNVPHDLVLRSLFVLIIMRANATWCRKGETRSLVVHAILQKIEDDIDMCLGVLSALLTHNELDLLSQDDMYGCLKVLDEKLRKMKGGNDT